MFVALLVAFATVLSVVFLLLPFFAIRRTWRQLPRKWTSACYFVSIGLGFIFFEIAMIQKMVLFLGYPTYSLTVTLSSPSTSPFTPSVRSPGWRSSKPFGSFDSTGKPAFFRISIARPGSRVLVVCRARRLR